MHDIYTAILDAQANGRPAALCTIIAARGSVPRHAGSKLLVFKDGQITGTIGGGELESRAIATARQVIEDGQTRIEHFDLVNPEQGDPGLCGGEVDIYIEPIKPDPVVLVIGGGHVGKAIVHLAKWLGFRVVLSDDRPEYCTSDWAPGADEYLPVPIPDLPNRFTIHPETYIVMPTRGAALDIEGLPHLLDQPYAYLGVIGSRRRWATAAKALRERGVSEAQLSRVHSPMGLELNAETPEEIALSIMAEIVMLQRGGTGEAMRMMSERVKSDPREK